MRFYLSLCRFARHLLFLLWRGTGDRLGLYVPATHMCLFSVRLWYLPGRTSSAGSPALLQGSHGIEKSRMIVCRGDGSPG